MIKEKKSKATKKNLKPGTESVPDNDGTNTPIPDTNSPHIISESEADLYRQAESPLGNPDGR